MDVDRARLDIDVIAPDRVEQLLARKDAARMLHQIVEQLVFRRAEMNVTAGALHTVRQAIDADLAERDAVFRQARTDAAQHGADACHQFDHGERLDDIVVGAGVEAADTVALFRARRQHDDRQVAGIALGTQAAADLDARHLGHHPVADQQVGHALADHHQRLVAVDRHADLVALLFKIVGQKRRQGVFVFGNNDVGLHTRSVG